MLQNTSSTNKIIYEQGEKTANDLIPELISKISKYSTHLKERVKIYSIFQEFDNYAHMNFKNFIKMSDKRYRSIKSGNNLRNVLINQKKECKDLSEKILSNKLYSDKNIEKEEKKLYKKINYKENKELYQIRHDIIEKTKDLTKKEIERREQYIKSRNLKFEKLKEKNKINKSTNNNKTSYESLIKSKLANKSMLNIFNKNLGNKNNINNYDTNSNYNNNIPLNDDIKSKTVNQAKEILKIKKDYLDNLVKKDNQNINDNILDYKLFLKDVENSKNKNNSRIINEGHTFGHTFSFKNNEIKLLSFQEEQKETEQYTKKENPEVNVAALIKYTKRGNRKWFLNNIKVRSKERQNSFRSKLKLKKYIYNTPKKYNMNPALITKSKSSLNFFKNLAEENLDNSEKEKIYSTVDSMARTDSTTFSNFRNTIKTVKNEAKMVRYMGRNFDNKRKTMEGFFKRINLPDIKQYEEMFNTRNNYYQNNKNNLQKNNDIKNDDNNNSDINKKNEKTDMLLKAMAKKSLKSTQGSSKKNVKDKLINNKIFADMQRTYNDKKKLWEKEDLDKENIKKEKLEHIKRTQQYLEEMAKNKRTPHLYVDPYSKRDDIINDRIKLFTRSLSGPFYSQKRMQSRIDDFNNYIEQKEIEKKIKDKKLAEALKEEELRLKEGDIQFQIKQKMIDNFAKEELNKKDNDIKLNYKFIPTLKATKKKDKNKSYKDFKEIYEIVKKKQTNEKN